MERALELAERALGLSSPNPAVGSVLVKDGRIVGEGWTQAPGQAHAEVVALQQAGEAAHGATLYVTLEPCCHWGRTPPCSEAIIQARVHEVHMAMIDPSPWVAGGGRRDLEAAGIVTVVGEREQEARRLNEGYFKYVRRGVPFVAVTWSMTLDGKVATRGAPVEQLTGDAAQARVGRLRALSDAVLVGAATVLRSDPPLTAGSDSQTRAGRRMVGDTPCRQPLRVVVDSEARTPPSARVVRDAPEGHTLFLVTDRAPAERRAALQAAAAEVVVVPDLEGRVHLGVALRLLAERGITSVLVETSGTVFGELLDAGLVDKVYAFVAAKLAGTGAGLTSAEGAWFAETGQVVELRDVSVEQLGEDLLVSGYLPPSPDDLDHALSASGGSARAHDSAP